MTVGIMLGTIPIAISGFVFKGALNACGSPFRGIAVIGWACVIMGLLLAAAERYGQSDRGRVRRQWNRLTIRDAILVGISQAFALIPGVSRSGSTLTAGLAVRMERATAAWFSFLLGVPAILLAGAVELFSLRKAGLSGQGWILLGVGLAAGSASAYLALWGLLRYLKEHTAWIFVWYRVALGVLLLVGAARGFLH